MKNLKVEYKDYSTLLNGELLKNKSDEEIERLKNTYIDMFKIFEKIENTSNRIEIYYLNKQLEPLEFKMQKIFGFKEDSNYHRRWFKCPKCSCPKMDNQDDLGTGIRHINEGCIIHGTKTANLIERKEKLEKLSNII